jgi:hypothetical protein
MLLAKDETVLQGIIDRLIEIGRRCGMEINKGGGGKGNGNLKAIISNTDC